MVFKYRRLTLSDIPTVLPMLKEFYLQSEMAPLVEWDNDHIHNLLVGLVKNKKDFYGLAAIDEDTNSIAGFITAIRSPSTFFRGCMANEQVWWVQPEYRKKSSMPIKLLMHFLDWAKESDCRVVTMGCAKGSTDMTKIYDRLGFTEVDSTYMKRL